MLFNHNNNTWNIILRNDWVIKLEFSIRLEEQTQVPKEWEILEIKSDCFYLHVYH